MTSFIFGDFWFPTPFQNENEFSRAAVVVQWKYQTLAPCLSVDNLNIQTLTYSKPVCNGSTLAYCRQYLPFCLDLSSNPIDFHIETFALNCSKMMKRYDHGWFIFFYKFKMRYFKLFVNLHFPPGWGISFTFSETRLGDFWNILAANFLTKVAQLLYSFLGNLQ